MRDPLADHLITPPSGRNGPTVPELAELLDWAREETVAGVVEIVLTERLQKA